MLTESAANIFNIAEISELIKKKECLKFHS